MKNNIHILVFLIINVTLLGCATISKEPGPKLYDNATFSIISDNTLLVPQTTDSKDFMRIILTRLSEFTDTEIKEQGGLNVVPLCGPRTLKITQDIASIVVSSVNEVFIGRFLSYLVKGLVTSTKNDDVSISINTSVVDCESGKKLGAVSYQSARGKNPIDLLKELAALNVYYAYSYQYGPK